MMGSAFFGGIAMAIYTPLSLVINRKFLPVSVRPGLIKTILLLFVSCFYIVFALFSVAHLITTLT